MKKILALAVTAGLMAVPVAFANDGPPPPNVGADAPVGAPANAAPGADAHRGGADAHRPKMVSYQFRGVVSAVGTSTITLSPVRGDGRAARMALAGAQSFTVSFDAKTKIRRGRMGAVTIDAVHIGDRVQLEIRAPRKTALADLPAARRMQVRGPAIVKPAVDPATADPGASDPGPEGSAAVDPAPVDPASPTGPTSP